MRSEKTYFEYDALDRLNKTTDPGGVATTFTYNARHQLTKTTHVSDGTHVDRAYDDLGNCTDVTDELGHTAHTNYDEYRRVTSVVTPVNDGITTNRYQTFTYDRYDNNCALIPGAGAKSHTASNPSASWAPSSKAVVHVFSPNNWLNDEFDGMWVSDNGNGTVTPHPGAGYVHTYIPLYSNVGQVLQSVDAQGKLTAFTYDNCGRKQSVTDPNGHSTSWTYYTAGDHPSYQGWLKSVTSPGPDLNYNGGGGAGTVTTNFTAYDPMGRVQSTLDPSSHTFNSGFDLGGNLTNQTDGAQAAGQHNTGYSYDQLGRKVSITNAQGTAKEKWTYDASGNVKTYQTYAGAVCTYQYDGRNRCSRYDWNDGSTPPTSYLYDAASRVTEIDNWHANVHYTYDDSGAVLSEQETYNDTGATGTVTYSRDIDGNVDHLTYPGGVTRYYHYDNQQRCTGMYAGSTTYSQYNYAGDRLANRVLGNGLYTAYAYQDNGRCYSVWHIKNKADGSFDRDIARQYYGFEPDGRLSWMRRDGGSGTSTSSLENGNGDGYAYQLDGSLRLAYRNYAYAWNYSPNAKGDSEVNVGSPTVYQPTADTYGSGYAYDAAGNRTEAYQGNPQAHLVYGAAKGDDGYSSPTSNGVASTWTYDNNFNTASCSVPGTGWTYHYDSENHLDSATGPGGASAVFRYDGLGRLCWFNINGTIVRFYYAGSQRIEERDNSNGLIERYYFDAPGSDQILCREGVYGTQYYQYDLQGNTTHLSDASGNVVEQYLYDAYGQPSVYDAAGSARAGSLYANRYQYRGSAGYYWFGSMQLSYVRARFYLPQHGRWLQTDPIGQKGGLNIYTYCGNDPVNSSDPSGLFDDRQKTPTEGAPAGNMQGFDVDPDPAGVSAGAAAGLNSTPDTTATHSGGGGGAGSGQEPVFKGGGDIGPANPASGPAGVPLSPAQRGVSTYSGGPFSITPDAGSPFQRANAACVPTLIAHVVNVRNPSANLDQNDVEDEMDRNSGRRNWAQKGASFDEIIPTLRFYHINAYEIHMNQMGKKGGKLIVGIEGPDPFGKIHQHVLYGTGYNSHSLRLSVWDPGNQTTFFSADPDRNVPFYLHWTFTRAIFIPD